MAVRAPGLPQLISIVLSMLATVLFFPNQLVGCFKYASFIKLPLPPRVAGPESLAFDIQGRGPYAGVADGRILKYQGPNDGFVDFATTSPLRTKRFCDGTNVPNLGPICGRPVGIAFNCLSGDLYIADSSYGLFVVGSNGGPATLLAGGVDGVPFGFLNAVDVDPQSKIVYFSDAGAIFKQRNITEIVLSGDTSGKLLKYDPGTKQVTLLLTGLSGANGVAVSQDGAFVLVSEYIAKRIRRYWIKGPLADTSDIFTDLQGSPDNIKRTAFGDFWVLSTIQVQPMQTILMPIGQRINPLGMILETINLDEEYKGMLVSEVQESVWGLFVGTPMGSFVGLYPR